MELEELRERIRIWKLRQQGIEPEPPEFEVTPEEFSADVMPVSADSSEHVSTEDIDVGDIESD